ncbi:hypothetical protein X551_02813 [Methylibium sp. T29]|nr:hypothetical protein X551_02813 [Methylibium sp. T29]EWS58708.1 hypothetical protein Y694_03413 [Methylibium sp. T29-B]
MVLKCRRKKLPVTLSQVSEPFGNRTTGMMEAPVGARRACREEEQVH